MSRPIDEKIVSLKLDDTKFKKNASESLSIFGKLQNSFDKTKQINLSRSVDSLKDVGRAADNVDISKLGSAVEGISNKFNAMNVIAFTVLTNITNKAINAGMQIARNLTLKPMRDGFAEYELKLGSIQTILANTSRHGTTLDDVTKSLDTLNEYADKTIYNFGDMTKNIGLFTNAGLGIEESTSMIKGFSNEAAASGTTAQGAAGAAYQLSQALSAGTIRLMDWRSLTNVGMGNKNMQNGLIEIADAMGMVSASGLTATEIQNDFNGSLENEWLSADVMSKYLQIMAGDMDEASMATLGLTESQIEMFVQQAKTAEEAATKVRTFTQLMETLQEALGSGWTETMELIFGDFYEATELWTGVSNAVGAFIDSTSKARNELLGDFVKLGGRKAILDSIVNTFKALGNIIGPVAKVFKNLIPPVTAEKLMAMTNGMLGISESFLAISGSIGTKAASILTTIIDAIKSGVGFVWELGKAFAALLPKNFTAHVKDSFKSILDGIRNSENTVGDFVNKVGTMFTNFSKSVIDSLKSMDNWIESVFSNSEKTGGAFSDFFVTIFGHIQTAAKKVWDVISTIDFDALFSAGFLAALFTVSKKFSGLTDKLGEFFDTLMSSTKERSNPFAIFEALGDSLSELTSSFKIANLIGIATAVSILALSLKLLESMDVVDITEGLGAIAGILVGLMASLKTIAGMKLGVLNSLSAVALIGALAGAVLILSGALKVMESIDEGAMSKSLKGLAGTIASLVTALKIMSMGNGTKIATSAGFLLGLSISIKIMVSAIKDMSEIDSDELSKGVIALGAILLELGIFMRIANGAKIGPLSAAGLVITAAAVKVMSDSISELGKLNKNTLIKGVAAVGSVLLELAVFSRLARGGTMILAGVGITIVARALEELVPPITKLGKTKLSVLATGIGAIAIALVSISLAMKVTNPFTLLLGAAAMTVMAEALDMMVSPIQRLGNMDIETLATGIGAMAIAMLSMALISRVGGIGGAVGLMGMALAIKTLVPPLETLGNMPLKNIAIGLGALAATFAVLAGTALLLSGATLALLGFAASLALIGAGVALLGVGLSAFATGLAILGGMSVATAKAIVATIETLLVGLGGLIPKVVTIAVELMVSILETIDEYLPRVIDAGVSILLSILDGIGQNIYELGESATLIVTEFARLLGDKSPELADAGVKLVVDLTNGMADGLRENTPEVISALMNMTASILTVISQAIEELAIIMFGSIPGFETMARDWGTSVREGIRQTFKPYIVGEDGAKEFIDGVERNRGGAKTAGENVSRGSLEGMNSIGGFTLSGESHGNQYNRGVNSRQGASQTSGRGLTRGIQSGASSISLTGTGSTVASGFARGVSATSEQSRRSGVAIANTARGGAGSVSFRSSGANAGIGFADGISSMTYYVRNAASAVASAASASIRGALRIQSPSRVTRESGQYTGEGLGLGIQDMTRFVIAKSKNLASAASETMSLYAESINDALNTDIDYSPRITPILDMSKMNLSDLERYSGGTYDVNTSGIDERSERALTRNGSSSGQENNYYYDVTLQANGELPVATIKKMAGTFMKEVKNSTDRTKLNRGELSTF